MEHGLVKTYKHNGCRCEPCTKAHTDYCRRQKAGQFKMRKTPTTMKAQWREQAACVGQPPLWFDIDEPTLWILGAQICHSCPVQKECYQTHINNPDAFGVYGGVPLEAGTPTYPKGHS